MKILQMVQFEETDTVDLRRIQEWYNEMRAFFVDPETENKIDVGQPMMMQQTLKWMSRAKAGAAVEKLSSGNVLAPFDLVKAALEFSHAHVRLIQRTSDQTFPQELKDRYDANMLEAYSLIEGWIRQTRMDNLEVPGNLIKS
jgi:hypothetical protein